MSNGLILGEDKAVIAWATAVFALPAMHIERALGVISPEGVLVAAIFLRNYNGFNIELSYYGKHATASPGIVRSIARIAVAEFNPSRATLITSKRNKHLISSLQKFGWRVEGVQRRYYGRVDCQRNKGVRLVIFREDIDRIASFTKQEIRIDHVDSATTGA